MLSETYEIKISLQNDLQRKSWLCSSHLNWTFRMILKAQVYFLIHYKQMKIKLPCKRFFQQKNIQVKWSQHVIKITMAGRPVRRLHGLTKKTTKTKEKKLVGFLFKLYDCKRMADKNGSCFLKCWSIFSF